jgi:hypothetical protein
MLSRYGYVPLAETLQSNLCHQLHDGLLSSEATSVSPLSRKYPVVLIS